MSDDTPSLFESGNVIKGSYNGLPYEGPPLTLKDSDAPKLKPRLKGTCKAKVFKMDSVGDVEEYNRIIQTMADGLSLQSIQEVKYNETRGSFDIFLRWLEFKYIAPEGMQNEQAGG